MMMDGNTPRKLFPKDLQNLPLQSIYNKRVDLYSFSVPEEKAHAFVYVCELMSLG